MLTLLLQESHNGENCSSYPPRTIVEPGSGRSYSCHYLTLDNHDAADDKSFELTGMVADHGMFRDHQKESGQIQSQSIDRKRPTRAVLGADLGEPQILGKMAASVPASISMKQVMVEPRYEKDRKLSRNHNATCGLWATQGYCRCA